MDGNDGGCSDEIEAARARPNKTRPGRGVAIAYALRQEKGAYCPLFFPVASSHARPSACT